MASEPTESPAAQRTVPLRRRLLYSLLFAALTYGVAEAVVSWLYTRGYVEPGAVWLLEDRGEGQTIRYDPVRGYWLSAAHPARMACVLTDGTVGSVGLARGNNAGFPDRDDFTAGRTPETWRRYAVFGLSYTAALFLPQSWPDAVEDLTRARSPDRRLELYNLSVDGGSIANWWSVIRGYLEAESIALDGVIFAHNVGGGYGGFVVWDDRVFRQSEEWPVLAQGRIPNLLPVPKTAQAARRYLVPQIRWLILPPQRLDRVLRGEERVPFRRPFKLFFAHRLGGVLRHLWQEGSLPLLPDASRPGPGAEWATAPGRPHPVVLDPPPAWPPARTLIQRPRRGEGSRAPQCGAACQTLVRRIDAWLRRRDLPALVVYLPGPLAGEEVPAAQARWLAGQWGARFVDGGQAFAGLEQPAVDRHYIPYEGHWNQRGSHRFAALMAEVIQAWSAEARP